MTIDEIFLIKEIEKIENKNLELEINIDYKKIKDYVPRFPYDWTIEMILKRVFSYLVA